MTTETSSELLAPFTVSTCFFLFQFHFPSHRIGGGTILVILSFFRKSLDTFSLPRENPQGHRESRRKRTRARRKLGGGSKDRLFHDQYWAHARISQLLYPTSSSSRHRAAFFYLLLLLLSLSPSLLFVRSREDRGWRGKTCHIPSPIPASGPDRLQHRGRGSTLTD